MLKRFVPVLLAVTVTVGACSSGSGESGPTSLVTDETSTVPAVATTGDVSSEEFTLTFEQLLRRSFPNITGEELDCMKREAPTAEKLYGKGPVDGSKVDGEVNLALAVCAPADFIAPQVEATLAGGAVAGRDLAECLVKARLRIGVALTREGKPVTTPTGFTEAFMDRFVPEAEECGAGPAVIEALTNPEPGPTTPSNP